MLQDKIFLHQCDIHRLPNAQEHQKQQGSHSRGRNEQALYRSNRFDLKGSTIVRGLYLREVKNFYSCEQISKVCLHYD